MNKVLSQEEIDALFSAMSSEELNLDTRSEQSPAELKIAKYDYRRAEITPQDQELYREFDAERNPRKQEARNREADRLYQLIRTIPVPVGGEIRDSKLTLNDLLKASNGDIIELNERVSDPIYLCVGGMAMFKGRIIQRRGKKAFEISEKHIG
jgi:flagellar motor switch protein FliM